MFFFFLFWNRKGISLSFGVCLEVYVVSEMSEKGGETSELS